MSCYKCPDRHMGCHSDCEQYAEWKAERQALAEREKERDAGAKEVANYILQSKERRKRRVGKK